MGTKIKYHVEDYLNKKHNKLTPFAAAGSHKGHRMVLCKCECGKETLVSLTRIANGMTKSCGCLKAESFRKIRQIQLAKTGLLKPGESTKNSLYLHYKWGAKQRRIDFNLTKEEFITFLDKNCYYCGCEPHRVGTNKSSIDRTRFHVDEFSYNGIDRLNNSLGYELNNCVSCCTDCNFAKRKMSEKQFLEKIKQIYIYKNLENVKT